MRIRSMTAGDAGEVAALCGQLGYPSTPAQVAHRFGLLAERPENAVFVAEDEDEEAEKRIAGFVHVQGRLTMESDPCAEIAGLVVDEARRGAGVGRALVAVAEAWAAERGYDEVTLRSNVARERAHRFYQSLGYTITKSSHVFRKAL
ncbi:MAG TPA: GNAT family N-acetyltransferase [Ktedonobacterales bacterium]|nr:GNAT family N-acetyltransferase [Ktedonobacterales bacterium]